MAGNEGAVHNDKPTLTILLIEDDEVDAQAVRRALVGASIGEFVLVHSATLSRGLQALAKGTVDIVLTDLRLPDSVGDRTVRRLHSAAPGLPIVVLTGDGDEERALACMRAGAQDYLSKAELAPLPLRRAVQYGLIRNREGRIRQLEGTLDVYRDLSSKDSRAALAPELAGDGALRDRLPKLVGELDREYRRLLELYLEHKRGSTAKPLTQMRHLTNRLGHMDGGALDLIDIHIRVVDGAIRTHRGRSQSYALEGRQLILELMALLVGYYRAGTPSLG